MTRRMAIGILLLAISLVALATPLWHPALHRLPPRSSRRPCYTLIDWLNATGVGCFLGGPLLGVSLWLLGVYRCG